MRTVRFELLRPDEILAEKARCPVIYQPIGPLEWHGPHLPLGVDPLHAEAVCRRVAEIVGGLVLPTLYWGAERERDPQMLRNVGFPEDAWVVGMDHPRHSMKSLYSMEDVFGMIVRARLDLIVAQGFKIIVLVSGHAAGNHLLVLNRLAKEYTGEKRAHVLDLLAFEADEKGETNIGHAEALETSLMMLLYPESVDLSKLPPLPEPMKNVDFGVVDGETFGGNPTPDHTLRPEHDPRRTASVEKAEAKMNITVPRICDQVRAALAEIRQT